MTFKFDNLREQLESDFDEFYDGAYQRLESKEPISDHNANEFFTFLDELFDSDNEYSNNILELLIEVIDTEGCLHQPNFATFIKNNASKFGEWIDEIIVHVAEKTILPKDDLDWYLNGAADPYCMDGDLYNGSRTSKSGVAANFSTPPEILDTLSKDPEWTIRWRVALNTSSSPTTLENLSKEQSEYSEIVVAAVAINQNASLETLKWIIENTDEDLRTLATKNPKCNSELTKIAQKLGLVETPFESWSDSLTWFLPK